MEEKSCKHAPDLVWKGKSSIPVDSRSSGSKRINLKTVQYVFLDMLMLHIKHSLIKNERKKEGISQFSDKALIKGNGGVMESCLSVRLHSP